jgi:hypothetical protein
MHWQNFSSSMRTKTKKGTPVMFLKPTALAWQILVDHHVPINQKRHTLAW